MSPMLSLMVGGFALMVSLSTLAAYAGLVAAKRADEQAARTPIPIRREARRVRRGSRARRDLRN